MNRRTLLRTGTGVIAAAMVGGCRSSQHIDSPAGSGPTGTVAPVGSARPEQPSTSTTTPLPPAAPAPNGAARLRLLRPTRITNAGAASGWTRVDAGRIRVPIAGRGGVPHTAVAAAVRVAGISNKGETAVTVVPGSGDVISATVHGAAGSAMREAGVGRAGATTSFVMLGIGAVDILHDAETTAVVVDVIGYFEPVDVACSGGRVVTIAPTRVLDTRAAARPLASGDTRAVVITDAIPATAQAALVQMTVASDRPDTEWTLASPDDEQPPGTIVVGPPGRRTAFTVVRLHPGGLALTSTGGGHATIDVIGYVTGDDAPVAIDGLYLPSSPTRVLDTRTVAQPIPDGSCRELLAGPSECGAVAVTVTTVATGDDDVGDVWWWSAGRRPTPGAALAQGPSDAPETTQLVIPAGRRGVAVAAVSTAAHVVVDCHGSFIGTRSTERVPICGAQPHGIQSIDMESHADEWLDYGTSTDGRPLRAFRFGSGPRTGLVTTGLHGDEHTGTSVLADLVTRAPIPGWTLWLIPVANPDARAANMRFVHDVDMNRDFPTDWSAIPQPTSSGCVTTRTGPSPHALTESRQLAAAMTGGPFRRATVSISHHDNYNWVAPQAGSPSALRELADAYATTAGLRLPGEGGSRVPTSPRTTRVPGGFETFAHSLGMASFLVENKAGYSGDGWCAGEFGLQPDAADVRPHFDALRSLLTDARLPGR